jgi:hypothetical protein
MNNEKISYNVKWSQPYPTDYITIDLRKVNEALIEEKISNAKEQFPEALEVINMIRNKK